MNAPSEQKALTDQLALLASIIWAGKMSHDRNGFGIRITNDEAKQVAREARTVLYAARAEAREMATEET